MLHTLERWLRWSTGLLAATALFTIMALTLVDVLGRKFFDASLPGALEMTEVLMVMVIFGALPMVSWRSEHVVFDSLDHFVPPGLRIWQARAVHLVCTGLFGCLSWLLTLRADRFAEYGDVTEHWRLPLSPVAWVMATLLAVTALVHLLFILFPQAEGSGPAASADEPEAST